MKHLRRRRTQRFAKYRGLPYGVRILTWSRAVRWIGWGFGEALLPVFIVAFSSTFAEAGLMSSTVEISSLLSLPLIGMWADKMSAKKLVLISLLFYPLVGVSYFLAGALGMAIFVVIARLVNGVVWELENIGIETYYRRTADERHIASSFGYIESWSHAAWILAALAGMIFVVYVPVHALLLLIAPFSLIAYLIAKKAPADKGGAEALRKPSIVSTYAKAVSEWRTWSRDLQLLGVLVLFMSVAETMVYFFVPIDAYLSGANLPMVVLIAVFGSLPTLFGYRLGKLADARNKYGLMALGLVTIAVIMALLALFPAYPLKLAGMFVMGLAFELFFVVQGSLITSLGSKETYGERGSAFESILNLGDLAAPLLIGVGLDIAGFSFTALIVAFAALLLAVSYGIVLRRR